MHIHFEKSVKAECDCTILSMSWMGKVPDDLPEDEGWKLNRTHYYQEGWLATGNVRGILGVTFTTSHWRRNPNDLPVRTNYNLRGHRAQITMVQWNEPYQKLASCDSTGIIFVWIKYEGRWSIELINDRSTPVTHFSWSHDGRMALICYQDGFVLVGSVAGQRYWSSMLNLDATITCGIWTPDDQQVFFGTSNAQVIVMDVHGTMISQIQLPIDSTIRSMAWSCEKFKMEENEEPDVPSSSSSSPTTSSFSNNRKEPFLLAIGFKNGLVYLMKNYDDIAPIHIWTGMQSHIMEWSNSGDYLAVAGSRPVESMNEAGQRIHEYFNSLHFYNHKGVRVLNITIPATTSPVTALTWGHNDKRIFAATGKTIHVGWVSKRVASLQLLCRLAIYKSLSSKSCVAHLPLPLPVKALITSLHAQTILSVLPNREDLREFVSHPPSGNLRLYCTMIRHEEDANQSPGTAYTLYLEYLGGLIPILKGKRTSKIRPEFVIYDPQSSPSSDGLNNYGMALCGGVQRRTTTDKPETPVGGRAHSALSTTYLEGTDMSLLFSDSSESEDVELCASPHMQRRRYKHRLRERERERLRAQEREWERNRNGGPPIIPDPATQMLNPQQLLYNDVLPESLRLVEVTSNIWGTKFKIHGLANSLPDNLGQVTYKTSLLHLQPRQMTLLITELRDDIFLSPESVLNNPQQTYRGEDEEEFTVIVNPETLAEIVPSSTTVSDIPPPLPPPSAASVLCNGAQNRCFLQPRLSRENTETMKREESEATDEPQEMNFRTLRSSLKSPLLAGRRKSQEPLSVRVTTTADVLQAAASTRPGCSRRVDCIDEDQPGPSNKSSLSRQSSVLSPSRTSWTSPPESSGAPRSINICPTSPPPIHVRRSFSASVLDSVENPGQLSLDIVTQQLREAEPKRLVLVKKRPQGANPLLKECGKSKSWDSCELTGWIRRHARNDTDTATKSTCPNCRFPAIPGSNKEQAPGSTRLPHIIASPLPNPKTPRRRSANLCRSAVNSPLIPVPPATPKLKQKRSSLSQEDKIERASESSENSDLTRPPSSSPSPPPPPAPTHRRSISLLTPLLRRREMASRNRSDSTAGVPPLNPKSAKFVAPDSPQHQPRSSPNTPAMRRKSFSKSDGQHGYLRSSPNPIRQLFINSPLFPRRLRNSLDPAAAAAYNKRKGIRQANNNPNLLDSSDEDDDDVMGSRSSTVPMTPGRQSIRSSIGQIPGGACSSSSGSDSGRSQLRQKLSKKKIHNVENSPIVPRRMQFVMHNKAPMWNENSQVYQLDFGGRVTQESAKNFQIEFRGKQVMQFGRIDGNAYTLDFQYPFSALQAFAVALANVTQRLK